VKYPLIPETVFDGPGLSPWSDRDLGSALVKFEPDHSRVVEPFVSILPDNGAVNISISTVTNAQRFIAPE
jgi:hypothetical protein